jgi:hypothetical protein
MPRRLQQRWVDARADQSPIGVIRCFDAESGQLAPLPHPTSPPRLVGRVPCWRPSQGLSIQITRHLIRHWSSALPSAYRPSPPCIQKVLSCFLLTPLCFVFPYQKPNHCITHHITMGSIGEEPAKCPMRVANTAAGGTKVLHVLL